MDLFELHSDARVLTRTRTRTHSTEQFEQKKFLQQHKVRADSYSKAAATMKKQRKKKNTAANADKEIKVNKYMRTPNTRTLVPNQQQPNE